MLHAASLDPSFGINGKLDIHPPGNFENNLSNVVTDASGRLYIYGACRLYSAFKDQPGVSRLVEDGAFDTGFGGLQNGFVSVPEVMATRATGLAFMDNGSFFMTAAANSLLPLINYDANGKYLGIWNIAEGQQYAFPRLLSAEDKLLVATTNSTGGVLYRRLYDGNEDGEFGTRGKVTFLTGAGYVATLHLSRSPDGTAYYLAGELDNDGFILRIKNNGELDDTFGAGGLYRIKLVGARFSSCLRVCALNNGNIVALVNASGSEAGSVCQLIYLTQNGQAHPDFNQGEPLPLPGEVGEDLAVQSDGKFLVAHRSTMDGNQLTRLMPDGAPDIEFGTDENGSLTLNDGLDFVKAVAVQQDGKIVVGGTLGSLTTLLRLIG
jgi:uncharacterized delta-60 repeat protein